MKDWQRASPSADKTHHVIDGRPMYAARYLWVLKYHEPGLAPAANAGGAFHIDDGGRPAYAARYGRTFGFYEGLAAVEDYAGWCHIRPDGTPLDQARYAWCGNYQEGRSAVRNVQGEYFHIDPAGMPAYSGRWRYAGDYRDGIAVIQDCDGWSTHIDVAGKMIHSRWFLDLDVFHKGFARARDEGGWMHVDRGGRPAYARRFAAVEPFYNGQARVERVDGGLEVIDEAGETIMELRPALRSEFASLSGDLVGFWRTEAICAAVELGVFEALPATTTGIAARCGLDPGRAPRLLRALEELHLVARDGDRWRLTGRGAFLRADAPQTLADAAVEYGRRFNRMWSRLPEALRAGGAWSAPDIFGEVARDPCRVAGHHHMLASYARHDYTAVPGTLPLRGDETILDAGGGVGVLAEMILRRHPRVRVVLLDRPEVVGLALVPPDLAGRLTVQPADLFQPWPVRGDAVLLSRVLHDWDDEAAIRLLRRAREVLPPGGAVYVVEMVLSEGCSSGSLCDLHLLAVTGGRERSETSYRTILSAAGFDVKDVVRLPALPSVIVGVAR
jgi:hypothetical protein